MEKKKEVLTRSELKTLDGCVTNCIPRLVFEYVRHNGYCCPACHSIIDREYTSHCEVCGQAFRWYGTVTRTVALGLNLK